VKQQAAFLWMDGTLVPWSEARIHVTTEAVIHAASIFEGIRAYRNAEQDQFYIFRCADHLRRLRQSAKIMRMSIPYSDTELTAALIELLRVNQFTDNVHLRPVVYFGQGEMSDWKPDEIETGVFIIAKPGPHRPAIFDGMHSCTSTWRRLSDTAAPPRVKASANYHNARLALVEAKMNGFGIPIMLNDRGKVSESPGSCFFMIRDGVPITPPVTSDILESITRSTIIELFAELGMAVREREIDRTEVYIADEAFFCGSGHEVQPIISIDHYPVGGGGVGALTARMQRLYFDVVAGKVPNRDRWLTPAFDRGSPPAVSSGPV
jgi:branched-chain amino acid aminotransferase